MNSEEKFSNSTKRRKGIKIVGMMRSFIEDGFDEIEDYHQFMKEAIKREQESTSRRLEEGASKLETEEREEYYEFFAEDYQKIGGVFEKLALDSFIVMLYARLETGMDTLCNAIRRDKQTLEGVKINLRYSDLRGNGYLDQARVYMEKVLGVDLDLGNNCEWPEIIALRTLRNAIVHENGWLQTKDATLKKLIKRGLVEIKQPEEEKNGQISGRVKVKYEYLDHILPHLRKFFKDIKV